MDNRGTKCDMHCIQLTQDIVQWQAFVTAMSALRVPYLLTL
jgi:hypothetical protein